MAEGKIFRFPLDGYKSHKKSEIYRHIEEKYPHMLSDEMSPQRLFFNLRYGKTEGKSVISGKPTKFNNITERYERFVDDAEKKLYVEQFRARMVKVYGKENLLTDPDHQKKMLAGRAIGKAYKWQDGTVTNVTGDYEYNFLDFLEHNMHFTSAMLSEPPSIYYKDGAETRFYLPDVFIPSLNLIVEIKGSNPHYQNRDEYKEKLKADATRKEGFNFIQVTDGYFGRFAYEFLKLVQQD